MIEEIIRVALRIALEVLCHVDLIQDCLGWVGVMSAWALSLGRASWDYDETRSILLGGAVIVCVASGGVVWWWSPD